MTVETVIRRPASARSYWGVVAPAAVGALILTLFAGRLAELARTWSRDATCSHGFLVPLVSGYFAWQVLRRRGPPRRGDLGAGLVYLAGGCLLHLAAVVVWLPVVDFIALAAVLYGALVLAGGREWARGFRFPVLFLAFLFPLPAALAQRVAVMLQGVVTGLTTEVLGFFLPAHRAGNWIHLPGQSPVEVGEACSGLRQGIAFAALALIVGHAGRRSLPYRALLLLSSAPVAVAANVLRVLLLVLVLRHGGDRWTQGAWHDAWGLLAMTLGLGLFLAVGWWLARLLPEPVGEGNEANGTPDTGRRHLGVACVGLGITLLGQALLLAHLRGGPAEPPPQLHEPLSRVPVSLGAWYGVNTGPATLPLFSPDSFPADDRLDRFYVYRGGDPAGGPALWCRLGVVHCRDGRDRLHHPRVCFPAAGRAEDPSGAAEVDIGDPRAGVRRFCFSDNAGRQYVYYYHYTLEPAERPDLSPLQRTYRRRAGQVPSVTVQVFTNARSAPDLDRVADFVRRADRELRRCLPPGARMGNDTLPVTLVRGP